jgi:hypothetical protein
MARQCVRRCSLGRDAPKLASMKTLLKLALAGVLAAVLVKWMRELSGTGVTRQATGQPVGDWEPDAGAPLRGENLSVEPSGIH